MQQASPGLPLSTPEIRDPHNPEATLSHDMAPPGGHKISSSNHKLYHEALRLASLAVYLSFAYGTLLGGAALHLAGVPVGFMLGLQDAPTERPQAGEGWVRTGALSLGTAGVVGLLVAVLVSFSAR